MVSNELAHRVYQHRWIVMAGEAEMSHTAVRLRFQERVNSAVVGEDLADFGTRSNIVKLPQVEMVGAQPAQSVVQDFELSVARPVGGLRCQKYIFLRLPRLAPR